MQFFRISDFIDQINKYINTYKNMWTTKIFDEAKSYIKNLQGVVSNSSCSIMTFVQESVTESQKIKPA
jgi:hypothetical protein